jgi:hypothetical protein
MTVLVMNESHLLQIINDLEKILLELGLIHLLFALDQSLEGGRLETDTRCSTAFFGFPLMKSNLRFLCKE